MADSPQAPARPWTPTENPGDNTYKHPVVYIGDHQLPDDESSVSSNEDVGLIQRSVPTGGAVLESELITRSGPIRFKSSQALRDDAAAQVPEPLKHQPWRVSQTIEASALDLPQSLRPRKSQQALSPKGDERLPENNPFRLSKTLYAGDVSIPKSPILTSPSPPVSSRPNVKEEQPPQAIAPSRLTDIERSESRAGLIQLVRPQSSVQLEKPKSPEVKSVLTSPRLFQIPLSKTDDDLPSVTGQSAREIKILLINPTNNKATTQRYLEFVALTLPAHVTVFGFTARRPAPTAVESHTDTTISTATCTKAIVSIAHKYDAFLVASFSHHSLIASLREQLTQPVIGTLEASIYASRMCGSKFGIISQGARSALMNEMSIATTYGLNSFFIGSESLQLDGVELEHLPEEEIENRVAVAARRLQTRGADCICLEHTGLRNVSQACQDAVGHHDRMTLVVDGLSVGVQFLASLVWENMGTAKGTLYNISSGHKSLK